MTVLEKILGVAGGVQKYLPVATAAVGQVQAELGASNGDPMLQATKKQLAISYILAAAHAGESVPIVQVQMIAVAVDMAASVAKALGAFGKTPAPAAVLVPAVAIAAAAAAAAP